MQWNKNVAGQKATILAYQDDGVTPVAVANAASVLSHLQVRATGTEYAAAAGTIAGIVDGEFEYTATQGETNVDGQVILYLPYLASTYAPSRNFIDIAASSSLTAAAIVSALLAYSHDTGATFKGLLERLEALAGGAYSTIGGVRTYYKRDGSTPAFAGAYDNAALSRGTCDITGSES